MCIRFTSITQNVWTAASMKTYVCYDLWLHILCRKVPNFKLFILVLFSSVLCCSRKCALFYLFLYVWILFGLGFLEYVEVQRGSAAKELGNIGFKYITSLVMNHVFVIVYIFLPFWALPKSFCCVEVRNVYR